MDNIIHWKKTKLDKEKLKDVFKKQYSDKYPVIIKMHFGEPGNKTAFEPKDIEPLIRAFQELNIKPILTDTPVAYNSPRGTVEGYKKAVKERGYTKLTECRISNEGIPAKTKDLELKVHKILAEAKQVLVLSHVKGHECTGMGGAIKNLGMGGVTSEGKELQHSLAEPKIIGECIGCENCIKVCPADAIKMVDGKAEINYSLCAGCSLCSIHCPHNVLESKVARFDDLLAQAAYAVISKLPKRTLYINVIKNVTEHCDCYANSGKVIAKDAGILISNSAIKIDRKSVEVIKGKNEKDVFEKRWKRDPLSQVRFLKKYMKS